MANATQDVTRTNSTNGFTAEQLAAFVPVKMADSEKHTFTMNLPKQLRDAIKADADSRKNPSSGELGVADNAVAREILAWHYGFNIVDNLSPRLKKGLSPEQKKAARAVLTARVKSIMEKLANGGITDEQLAALGIT